VDTAVFHILLTLIYIHLQAVFVLFYVLKGKVIPLQARCGPEGG